MKFSKFRFERKLGYFKHTERNFNNEIITTQEQFIHPILTETIANRMISKQNK